MKPLVTLPGLDLAPVTRREPLKRPLSAGGRVRKGTRIEREIAELHAEFGIVARRVPGSGNKAGRLGPDFGGDLRIWVNGDGEPPMVGEVKSRAAGSGFVTLERWLGRNDVLFLRRDRSAPMVVMNWETWATLIARGRA